MRFLLTYLLIFFLTSSLALSNSVLQFDDSTKTPFSKYDSLKYSFLPKYEIYGRYFNPFLITNSNYSFDFGFKWYRKKQRYLTCHLIARAGGAPVFHEMLTLNQMYRLTPRFAWVHAELSYGLAFSHRYDFRPYYTEHSWGMGLQLRNEIQFDVGPQANISLGMEITPHVMYNFRKQHPMFPPPDFPKVENGFSTIIFLPQRLYVGFNLYIA
jgi:hypothetical protein